MLNRKKFIMSLLLCSGIVGGILMIVLDYEQGTVKSRYKHTANVQVKCPGLDLFTVKFFKYSAGNYYYTDMENNHVTLPDTCIKTYHQLKEQENAR